MGREARQVVVAITTEKPERIEQKIGRPMYSDEIVEEVQTVVGEALQSWYAQRGHYLLACEPTW